MPTRERIIAATPKCDRLCGPVESRRPCGRLLLWVTPPFDSGDPGAARRDPTDGEWHCPEHGPMLTAEIAARRVARAAA